MTYLTEAHDRDFLSALAEVGGDVQDVATGLALDEARRVLEEESRCFDLKGKADDAFTHEAKLALRRALAGFVAGLED